MLPDRKTKERMREDRWRCPAHTGWLTKSFACCMCGSTTNTVAAHVRLGSHTAMGRKPDDWRTVPLCDGPSSGVGGALGCHNRQGLIGEATFWAQYEREHGQTVDQLLGELAAASPKSAEIKRIKAKRANG